MRNACICLIWIACAMCSIKRTKAQEASVGGLVLPYSSGGDKSMADTVKLFTIREINITGNKQTNFKTILRELPFKIGEQYTISDLALKFSEAKRRLMNTALFHTVVVSLNNFQGQNVSVNIDVKERWYIIPLPYLKVVDRSWGEWVQEKGMKLERIIYGIRVKHYNISGRNDKLFVNFKSGYTKEAGLAYYDLVLDKKLKWKTSMGLFLGKNKEVNYETIGNKQVAYKDSNNFVQSYFRSFLEVSYRQAINTRHTFGISYNIENVDDTIHAINQHYAPAATKIRYPSIYYTLSYNNADYLPYPTKGYITEVSLIKRGIHKQPNLWELTAKGSASWPLNNKYFVNLRMVADLKLPFKQPYINQQFMGYKDMYMQGYEYYVVDGVAGGYAKLALTRELFNTSVRLPANPITRINKIPFRAYFKIYGNAGYAYNPNTEKNSLTNRSIFSGGFGVDVVTFYDIVIKLEYSFNQLGKNGLFLHKKDYF